MIILLSIFVISTLIISGKNEFKFYFTNLVYLIVLFALVISVLELLDLLDIFSYKDFSQIDNAISSSSEDSVTIDSNFALLPVFFGMIGAFYLLRKDTSKVQKIYYNLSLVIFSLNILLSGSRRGLILFIVIFLVLTIVKFVLLFKKNNFFIELGSNSGFFLISVLSLTILLNLFFFHTSFSFKTKTLEYLGARNVVTAKHNISKRLFKYSSAVNKNTSFSELLFSVFFDSKDPDSGWGNRIHKTIFPLTGENAEIVPYDAFGYLMDSTCNGSYYPDIDLCESFTMFTNLKVNKGDQCKASVYCFVSDSFDVNSASCTVGSLCISNNIVSGKVTASYDLLKKGVWQKLEVEFICDEGEVPIYLSFWKKAVKDFSKLKGYIIFAYPQYEKTNKSDNESSPGVTQSKSNKRESGIIDLNKKKVDQKYTSSGLFGFPLSVLLKSGSLQDKSDPIRNWAAKFISEDTTYYPYKANIVLGISSDELSESRLVRWQFGWQIFTKEYNWTKRIFGGGFSFLNWYGYYFLKDKTQSDWPHNPFLSILLYSGIVGLLIYCFLLYKVSYYYLKYIKEYPLLFIFFIITFFFSFFSGGSPFDPPIMGFFVILPFFIHSVHKKMLS